MKILGQNLINIEDRSYLRHRSNDIVSGTLHLIGTMFSIAVLVVLVVLGAKTNKSWHIVSYALYGSGLILLYIASTTYHLVPRSMSRFKQIAQKFDHSMIYVLIAATYTPIAFIVLSGGWRWAIFGIIWGLAIAGIVMKIFWSKAPSAVAVSLYVLMGWLVVIAISPLIQNMTTTALWLLFLGGLSYTFGVIFFTLEHILPQRKFFWMHEVFHVFVLGGSTLHTIMMFLIL